MATTPKVPPYQLGATGVTDAIYGDSSHIPQITVNPQGQITSAVEVAIAGTGSLADLTDVNIDAPSAGQILVYSEASPMGYWQNEFPTSEISVDLNGSPAASGDELDFVAGSGITIGVNQSSPTDPIAITIYQAGNVRAISGTDNILTSDSKLLLDSTGGIFTVTLPLIVDCQVGQQFTFKKVNALNVITIDGSGAETIDGAADTTLLTQWASVTVFTDGNAWFII